MKFFKNYCLMITMMVLNVYALAQDQEAFNVLSIPNGAYIYSAPPTYAKVPETANKIMPWTKEAIIDGSSKVGWSSSKNAGFPLEFVFELSEECVIEKMGFNTEVEKQYKGIHAQNITIEFSTESPTSGYEKVSSIKLKGQQSTKYFQTGNKNARWIKVSILSNGGYKAYTELMEIEAIGKYVELVPRSIDLTGDWESNWGLASFRQNGSKINGCYEYRNGIIENAGMDRRILTYKWVEQGQNGIGKAVLVVNSEGDRLNGIWGFGDNLKTYGIWVFRKKSDQPSLCYQEVENTEQVALERTKSIQRMQTELQTSGKLTVYGINFETNSDVIKNESYPTLDEIYDLLELNPDMSLYVEGHTDDRGSDTYNKELSEKRAISVKNYITNKGIAAERLSAVGRGEMNPIADNDTALGRAANRRVELRIR